MEWSRGIVLASVAFDAGIINMAFYTTLILLAVLTSQAAGAWLEHVPRRGWPLLSGEAITTEAGQCAGTATGTYTGTISRTSSG